MAQLVIPTFSKLELAFPDAVFELYQQMKLKDSLSFQALGSQDLIYNVNIKKLDGFVSQFQIESTEPEGSVLELKEDSWRCELKGITSEAFLLPGHITDAAYREEETKEEVSVAAIMSSPSQQAGTEEEIDNSQEDSVLTAIATTITTSDVTTELDLPKTETASMEDSLIPTIMPLDGITLVTPGDSLTSQGQEVEEVDGEVDTLPLEGDEPEEQASKGRKDTGGTGDQEEGEAEMAEGVTDKSEVVEIVFGKNKKITVNRGSETQVLREEEQVRHDKMVQSEVSELLNEDQDMEDSMATSFNLDMTLTEAAIAVDRAQDAVKELIQKKATQKFIDQSCQMSKFPIVMEGNKYKCHLCGLLLIKKHYLVAHMRYVHKICVRDPLSRLQCPHCDLTFVRKNRLDEHIAHKHTDRKDHYCDIAGCEMAFKTIYNLRDHKRIYHYHMLRYACDICGKLYENPNTAERHRHICASKDPDKYGKKTAEQLRNPDWVPIDELFMREPLPKRNKSKNRDVPLKEEPDAMEVKYDLSENALIVNNPPAGTAAINMMKSKNQITLNIKSEKVSSQSPIGQADPVVTGNRPQNVVISEDAGKYLMATNSGQSGKRKPLEMCANEVPVLKKTKTEDGEDTKLVMEHSESHCQHVKQDTTPLMARVKVEDEENSVHEQPESRLPSSDAVPKASNSKATQLPLKDLLKFIKKKEAASRKQGRENNEKGDVKSIPGSNNGSISSTVAPEKALPSFTVTGILNRHKVYPLKLDELRRRLYGPETLNPVALMSFVNKTEQCSKMAELKRQLTEIGFTVPRFTTVTSSFTKLCEGEIADLFTDLQDLQETYLKPENLEKSLINKLLVCSHESTELATWLQQIRDLLQNFQKVLYEHTSDFDQVTHGLAKHVFHLFLALYEQVLSEAVCKFERRQAFYEDLTGIKENKKTGGLSQEVTGNVEFEVQSLLSIKNTSYTVSSSEIQRRSQMPEQMAISLLQQYIHKSKDKVDLEKACEGVGVILQRGNRTYVKSCLSLLVEADANKLCTDFEVLFDDHVEQDDVMREFVKAVSIETKKGQLIQILHNACHITPHVESALRDQCQDFELVTHGMGSQLAEFTWTTFVKVLDLARDFCHKM